MRAKADIERESSEAGYAMRSAKARLIGASYRLRHLVERTRFAEAAEVSLQRGWMGPFAPNSGVEEVPPHIAERLNQVLDMYTDAVSASPPDREAALLACALHQAVVDRVR